MTELPDRLEQSDDGLELRQIKPTWRSDDGLFVGRIEVTAGYDHRDDPADNRGAHGVDLWVILDGPEATMAGRVGTGWMARPLLGSYRRGGGSQVRADRPGVDRGLSDRYPTGAYLGIHSTRQVKDWWQGPDANCSWIDGPCYGDGGYLVSDEMLARLIADGHDGAFRYVRECYDEWMATDG